MVEQTNSHGGGTLHPFKVAKDCGPQLPSLQLLLHSALQWRRLVEHYVFFVVPLQARELLSQQLEVSCRMLPNAPRAQHVQAVVDQVQQGVTNDEQRVRGLQPRRKPVAGEKSWRPGMATDPAPPSRRRTAAVAAAAPACGVATLVPMRAGFVPGFQEIGCSLWPIGQVMLNGTATVHCDKRDGVGCLSFCGYTGAARRCPHVRHCWF